MIAGDLMDFEKALSTILEIVVEPNTTPHNRLVDHGLVFHFSSMRTMSLHTLRTRG